MWFYNIYQKKSGEIVLKRLKNEKSYENWKLIDTYIVFEDKLYKYEDLRKKIKEPQKNNLVNKFVKITNFIKNL